MYTCLGAQPSEGIFALKLHGRTFKSGHFTRRCFKDGCLEALVFTPSQIHAKQHLCPVLSFSAAGPCLHIKISIVWIHFTGEHAAKFQLLKLLNETINVSTDRRRCLLVFLGHSHFKKIVSICDSGIEVVDGFYHGFEGGALAP